MKTKKSSSPTTKGPKETEVWIMYAINSGKRPPRSKLELAGFKRPLSSKVTMISAWRYPGKTKPGAAIPIPNEIVEELTREGLI